MSDSAKLQRAIAVLEARPSLSEHGGFLVPDEHGCLCAVGELLRGCGYATADVRDVGCGGGPMWESMKDRLYEEFGLDDDLRSTLYDVNDNAPSSNPAEDGCLFPFEDLGSTAKDRVLAYLREELSAWT